MPTSMCVKAQLKERRFENTLRLSILLFYVCGLSTISTDLFPGAAGDAFYSRFLRLHYGVHTAPRVQSHASTPVCTLKGPNPGSHTLLGHTKMLHTPADTSSAMDLCSRCVCVCLFLFYFFILFYSRQNKDTKNRYVLINKL